jgi:hypothetical protein
MRRLEQPIPEDVMPVQRTARPGNGVKQSDKIYEIDDSRRLQLLIDAVVDYAIYMIRLDGHVLSWNSGGRRLKGYESHEIIGQPFSRFFTAEDQANGLPQRALAAAAKEGMFETEGWQGWHPVLGARRPQCDA